MKEERAEIYETYRSSFRLMINTVTLATTAYITVIGFAVNNKSALLVFFGSLLPLLLLFCLFLFSRLFCTVFFSGMRLYDQNEEQSSLFFSTTLFLSKPAIYRDMMSIISIDDAEDQLAKLQQIKSRFMPPFVPIVIIAFTLLQALAAICLWCFFDWPFP